MAINLGIKSIYNESPTKNLTYLLLNKINIEYSHVKQPPVTFIIGQTTYAQTKLNRIIVPIIQGRSGF